MLEYFKQLVPLLDQATFGKGSIGLYDREQYLVVTQGSKLQIPLKAGDPIAPGTSSYNVIRSGKPYVAEVSAEALGIPYFAAAYPIVVDGEIIGGLVAAVPTEMKHISEELLNTATSLSAAMQQISASVEEIASSSQFLAGAGQTLSASSQNVKQKAEETEKVVHYIDSVATNTKLLGLNASIEAARAGEVGRGFGVVANEIQKMAVSSADSAKEIRTIVQGIRDLIGGMVTNLDQLSSNTSDVSAAIQEIGSSLSSLIETTEHLKELATKL
ncbi:methyl-accepting chemotaxis protein [Paradesulfitobacterium aromaticivorans]